MTTNPTMRVVWFEGRAYPVSSHPRGIDDPGTYWHVQTPDGEWHPVVSRTSGDAGDSNAWRAIMAAITTWLEEHGSKD